MRRGRGAALVVVVGLAVGLAPAAAPAPAAQSPGDARWVEAAYLDLLGRGPSEAALDHRLDQLAAGRTRLQVASELAHSTDRVRRLVVRTYGRVLDRSPGSVMLGHWIRRLRAGLPVVTMVAHLAGSAEAYDAAGRTPEAYVERTYRVLLGRAPDAAGRAHWLARLAAGAPRYQVARALYLSPEGGALRATLAYLELLHRPATVAERDGWGRRLATLDQRELDALLLASSEHARTAGRSRGFTSLSGGLGTGSGAVISDDGRTVAFLSPSDQLTATSGPGLEVLVLDRETGRFRTFGRGNGPPRDLALSADGSTLAFASAASDLVPGDTGGHSDIFLVRLADGTLRRVAAGNGDSTEPALDGTGRTLAFTSEATDLGPPDPSPVADVYAGGLGDEIDFVRIGGDARSSLPSLSGDGEVLALRSSASDLGPTTDPGPDDFWVQHWWDDPTPVALSQHSHDEALPTDGPALDGDGDRVAYVDGLPQAGAAPVPVLAVALVEAGAVVGRTVYEVPGVPLRITLAAWGSGVATDHVDIEAGRPLRRGLLHWHGAPDRIGYDADLDSQGTTAVATSQALTVPSSAAVWLYDAGLLQRDPVAG